MNFVWASWANAGSVSFVTDLFNLAIFYSFDIKFVWFELNNVFYLPFLVKSFFRELTIQLYNNYYSRVCLGKLILILARHVQIIFCFILFYYCPLFPCSYQAWSKCSTTRRTNIETCHWGIVAGTVWQYCNTFCRPLNCTINEFVKYHDVLVFASDSCEVKHEFKLYRGIIYPLS